MIDGIELVLVGGCREVIDVEEGQRRGYDAGRIRPCQEIASRHVRVGVIRVSPNDRREGSVRNFVRVAWSERPRLKRPGRKGSLPWFLEGLRREAGWCR